MSHVAAALVLWGTRGGPAVLGATEVGSELRGQVPVILRVPRSPRQVRADDSFYSRAQMSWDMERRLAGLRDPLSLGSLGQQA